MTKHLVQPPRLRLSRSLYLLAILATPYFSERAHGDILSSGDVCINTVACPSSVIIANGFSSTLAPVNGSLTITTPSVITTGILDVARGFPTPNPNGQLFISGNGAGINVSQQLSIGNSGLGVVSVSSGGFLNLTGTSALLGVGPNFNANGVLNVTDPGSRVLLSGATTVGGEGSGSINVSNSATLSGNSMSIGGFPVLNGAAAMNITGSGSVTLNTLSIGSGAPFGQPGTVNIANSGILNAGTLNIGNMGTVSLGNGGIVSTSELKMLGGPGALQQATLTGIGTITGNLIDTSGLINPGIGSSFGQLTLNGNLTLGGSVFGPTGTLDLSVGGLSASSRDFLQVNGTANLSGGRIQVDFTNGFVPLNGQSIPLISATAGVTGTPVIAFSQAPSLPYTFSNGNLIFGSSSTAPDKITLVGLAQDVYNSLGNQIGYLGYHVAQDRNLSVAGPQGFAATTYQKGDQIVIAVRGTFPNDLKQFAYNAVADASFVLNPTPELVTYVAALANLLVKDRQAFPSAQITLTGHSLGGAIAQIVANAAHIRATTFDAPGAAQLYDKLLSTPIPGLALYPDPTLAGLSQLQITSPSSEIKNYRLYGDQISLVGTQIASTVITVNNKSSDANIDAHLYTGWLNTHLDFDTLRNQMSLCSTDINCSTERFGAVGKDITGTVISGIQGGLQAIECANLGIIACTLAPITRVEQFLFNATPLVPSFLDPGPGQAYIFKEQPGSPLLTSIQLPLLDDVFGWAIQYEIGSEWSPLQKFFSSDVFLFPTGVSAIAFIPLDLNGDPTFNGSPFAFGATFDSTGPVIAYAGDLSAVPEPSTLLIFLSALIILATLNRLRPQHAC